MADPPGSAYMAPVKVQAYAETFPRIRLLGKVGCATSGKVAAFTASLRRRQHPKTDKSARPPAHLSPELTTEVNPPVLAKPHRIGGFAVIEPPGAGLRLAVESLGFWSATVT